MSIIDNNFINNDEWKEYSGEGNGKFLGYQECNDHLIQFIENVLAKAVSFEELKLELLDLKQDRISFAEFSKLNMP